MDCNACGGFIASQEVCVRTIGEFYHLACEKALQEGVPRVKMPFRDCSRLTNIEFYKLTDPDYDPEYYGEADHD